MKKVAMPKEYYLIQFLAFTLLFIFEAAAFSQDSSGSTMLDVNYRKLISRADLHYDKQVRTSMEGLPVGNGVMGSLVWTTPKQLKLQINRVDVYCANSSTNSFPRVDSDYSHGCGFIDVEFADYGPDSFPADNTQQHLSLYDGVVSVKGNNVSAEVFALPQADVMAVRITDNRDKPDSIKVTLRALRPVTYR
ncbi:MAG: DUF5703 domain-containing protein, partial [Planctomycetota bacterium]